MTIFFTKMVNNLGVDPNEWFEDPKDEVQEPDPITDDYAPCDVEYDIPSEEMPAELLETPTSVKNPKPKPKKVEETIHEKLYQIATAKYNPFAIGGSENLGGGSEERLEEEFTPENDPYGGY